MLSDELRATHDDASRRLLIEASVHAAAKLTEIESRSRYVHDLHDTQK